MAVMQLTWAGFDAAIDVIAALVDRPQDRSGVYGGTDIGRFMAVALAYRLGTTTLELPSPGMLLVDGLGYDDRLKEVEQQYEDSQTWVWIDSTPGRIYQSVMKADDKTRVCWPWEDALVCPETFVDGFHD